jgi:hypothetical protein
MRLAGSSPRSSKAGAHPRDGDDLPRNAGCRCRSCVASRTRHLIQALGGPEPFDAPAGAEIVRGAGSRATGCAPAARCARPPRARFRRAQWPPERWAAAAGVPRLCATTTDRSRDALPGRWERAAAAIAVEREAATDAACDRADWTAPARSPAGPRDPARAAWDCGCRVAGRAGCRSCPWRSARARRAREAKRDQGQVIAIQGFCLQKAANGRMTEADP